MRASAGWNRELPRKSIPAVGRPLAKNEGLGVAGTGVVTVGVGAQRAEACA